jgi:hypothetical protein
MRTMSWRKVVWTTVTGRAWVCAMVLGPGFMRAQVTLVTADLENAGAATTIAVAKRVAPANPKLVKLPFSFPAGRENPLFRHGRISIRLCSQVKVGVA